ncbi:hypothetical protein ACYULU_07030 [Breznakiellaceae bacterium SP9]
MGEEKLQFNKLMALLPEGWKAKAKVKDYARTSPLIPDALFIRVL